MKIIKEVFPNGLRILLSSRRDLYSVHINLTLRAGSRRENPETSGISHFLEHMFFRGGSRYSDQLATSEAVEGCGGEFNAQTSRDDVSFTVAVPAEELEKGLDVLSDMLINARLQISDIKAERGPVLEEISSRDDDLGVLVYDSMYRLLFGDTSLGRPVVGTRENIRRFTRNDLLGFRNKNYRASDAVLSIVGNVRASDALRLARKYFSDFASNGFNSSSYDEPIFSVSPTIEIIEKDTEQIHFILAVPGLSRTHHLSDPMKIATIVLGGGMSSRLFKTVRTEKSLAYSVFASSEANHDYGLFMCYAMVNPVNINTALNAVCDEIRLLKNNKISERELMNAKRWRTGCLLMQGESSDAIAAALAGSELFYDKAMTPSDIAHETDTVSSEEIIEVSNELFRPENYRLSVVGPYKGDIKELENILHN